MSKNDLFLHGEDMENPSWIQAQ